MPEKAKEKSSALKNVSAVIKEIPRPLRKTGNKRVKDNVGVQNSTTKADLLGNAGDLAIESVEITPDSKASSSHQQVPLAKASQKSTVKASLKNSPVPPVSNIGIRIDSQDDDRVPEPKKTVTKKKALPNKASQNPKNQDDSMFKAQGNKLESIDTP